MSIEDQVRQVIVDQLGVAAEHVTPEARLADDLGADDLDRLEVVMALEEEFDVVITDEEMDNVTTVADAIALVKSKVRHCRICGCTDDHACDVGGGPCTWVESDLCSNPECLKKAGR